MELRVEVNSSMVVKESAPLAVNGVACLITPPIDEDYWIARVKVSDEQAVVAFPKFRTIGIGFQKEEDWNTNLPASSSAERIFGHIAHNKGDDDIPNERCIEAIQLLQVWVAIYRAKAAA